MQLDTHRGHLDRGLLAEGGTDMLHAVVHTAAAPLRPPTGLESLVREVVDPQGRLIDWELVAAWSPEAGTNHHRVDEFHAWRSTFAVERVLCERALAIGFVHWVSRYVDTSALALIGNPKAHLRAPAAIHLKWQLDLARQACSAHPESAIGLFTRPDQTVPVRGFVASDPAAVVITGPHFVVTAGTEGLELTHHAAGESTTWTVTGWRSDDFGMVMSTPDGEHALGPAAADLLRLVGQHHRFVEVRWMPLQRLFAPLLAGLHDASTLAISCHTGITFYSGWRTGSRH